MKKIIITLSCLLFLHTGVVYGAGDKKFVIKFATLAPEGTTWLNVMNDLNKEIQEKSNGRLKFKIYSGGVMGDEKDVIRKMRLGQIQSAGFTGVGLGTILPEVRIMDLPFLFKDYDEVDHVCNRLYERFSTAFEKKGYVLLGWAEVGFVHIFSRKPIRSLDDMRDVKMWMWQGDPLARAMFDAFNLTPHPLSVTDVLLSLQTKLIDTVYISPLGAIAMQWFTKVKYMSGMPIADAMGGILITKRFYDKLPADLQLILKETVSRHMVRLIDLTRKDNNESIEIMKKRGIKVVPVPDEIEMKRFLKTGEEVRNKLVNNLYSREVLNEVLKAIDEYRMMKKR